MLLLTHLLACLRSVVCDDDFDDDFYLFFLFFLFFIVDVVGCPVYMYVCMYLIVYVFNM